MTLVHATCVAVGRHGVLLRGPSGSGKSDLGLRLIDAGASLVADDQVSVTAVDGRLRASAPQTIRGLIEVRGIGVLPLPSTQDVELSAVVDLVAADEIERLPAPATVTLDGIALPLYRLDARAASAAAKIRLLLQTGQESIGAG